MKRAIVAVGILATVGCGLHLPPIEWPMPEPTPTPTPAPTPTPEPTPTPDPCSVCPVGTATCVVDGAGKVSCIPDEPPVVEPTPEPPIPFPIRFPLPGTRVYMRNHKYGNGIDATPRISGDPELCRIIHGVEVNDCHFDGAGWYGPFNGANHRATYEGYVLAGARHGEPTPPVPLGPVWEFAAGGQTGRCHDDRENVNTSCDHFGSAFSDGRDDPQTPGVFEGEPKWLAAQSDEYGPYAGWFTVPQTTSPDFGTKVRACTPRGDAADCAPWINVDWK